MATVELSDELTADRAEGLPIGAAIAAIAAILAAWIGAGSIGVCLPPLQKALAWACFAVMLAAAWPGPTAALGRWLALVAPAIAVAVVLTAFSSTVANVLAPAVALAMLAYAAPGVAGRRMMPAAAAVGVLGVFRLALESIPAAWFLADGIGRGQGWVVGGLTGRPLWIGATFGGTDFLVLMSALWVAWLIAVKPGKARAFAAALLIVAVHGVYLAALAFSDDLVARLPEPPEPAFTGISRLGVWSWSGALRSMLPWNLPLLAAVGDAAVAAWMLLGACGAAVPAAPVAGGTPAPQGGTPAPQSPKARRHRPDRKPGEPSLTPGEAMLQLAPMLLAVVLPLATVLAVGNPGLKGRRVMAYDPPGMDWSKPDGDRLLPPRTSMFGLLPELVESLGGEFVRSAGLSEDDLQRADVLLLLPRGDGEGREKGEGGREYCTDEQLHRITGFLRGGRSVLVAAGPGDADVGQIADLPYVRQVGNLPHNQSVGETAIRIRDDAAVSLTQHWEHNLSTAPHAAGAGLDRGSNPLGLGRAASLGVGWPARPLVVGRWATSEAAGTAASSTPARYVPGEKLGDVVLAAEQRLDAGRVVVLGDAACLSNEGLPFAHPLVARLLGHLAAKTDGPQAAWRQALGLAAAVALIVLLTWRAEPRRLAATALILAAITAACQMAADAGTALLPEGRCDATRPVAYVDGSHLPASSGDPWAAEGIGELTRTLARSGFLPLVAPDLRAERLERAALLVSIAPARSFSTAERKAVRRLVDSGGVLVNTVGSPEAAPSRELLAEFGFSIAPETIPPSQLSGENEPLGASSIAFPDGKETRQGRLYAGWTIEDGCLVEQEDTASLTTDAPLVGKYYACRRVGEGMAILIGDTCFALNKNLGPEGGRVNSNVRYLGWVLEMVAGRKRPAASRRGTDEPVEGGLIDVKKPPKPDPATR